MNFPRTLVHEGLTGAGAPLVTIAGIDASIADKYARFSMACLQPGFLYLQPQRQALDLIRAKNPAIKILVHFPIHTIWGTPGADFGYQSRFAEICARPGGVWNGTKRPNITRPDRLGEMVDLWSEVLAAGAYDGLVMDPTCAVNVPDWSDDGRFGTEAQNLATQRAAFGQIFATLRRRHPGALLIGCGGPSANFPAGGDNVNGYWLENFPEQNPTGWSACTRLCMDAPFKYAQPHLQVIAMARNAPFPADMRFGLGTSCLFDGAFAYGPPGWGSNPGESRSAHLDWIAPEALPLGWLGQPVGAPWAASATRWERSFEHGSVVVDTFARDAYFTRR